MGAGEVDIALGPKAPGIGVVYLARYVWVTGVCSMLKPM